MAANEEYRMHQRALWHDYTSRSLYMITIRKSDNAPDLAVLKEAPSGAIYTIPSESGKIVQRFLCSIVRFHPGFRCWKYVIMPDHIHFILFASKITEFPLWAYIRDFISDCAAPSGQALLANSFHDRVVISEGQVDALKKYIDDNPRRLWFKRKYPDFLSIKHRIRIGDEDFETLGNIFLLNDFDISAVRISSKFTPEELNSRKQLWLKTITNGGVIASPFISQAEKRVRDYALICGGKVILLASNGFSPRFKPPGELFDYCLKGKLLIIAPLQHNTRKATITREKALFLNDCAEAIASHKAIICD